MNFKDIELSSVAEKAFSICESAITLAQDRLTKQDAALVVNTKNSSESGATHSIDKYIEDYVVDALVGAGISVLTEESGIINVQGSPHFAILDPIDGTSMALRGLEFYSVCLALGQIKGGLPILRNVEYAVVSSPLSTFYAAKGQGSFQNGKRILTSTVDDPKRAICRIPKILDFDTSFVQDIEAIFNLGCTSLEMCMIAAGKIDCYLETKRRKVFDFAAAQLIVSEAGGIVSDIHGNSILDVPLDPLTCSQLVVTANPTLHKRILDELL